MRVVSIAAISLASLCGLVAPTSADPAVPWAESRAARHLALRLRPGQDLLDELKRFARERGLAAGFVASCAGSARRACIRFANQPSGDTREGHFEIVSLSGTLSAEGAHLHVALSDSTGATFGGHLLSGTILYTTAEIVLGEPEGVEFAREPDSTYGYRELAPRPRSTPKPRR